MKNKNGLIIGIIIIAILVLFLSVFLIIKNADSSKRVAIIYYETLKKYEDNKINNYEGIPYETSLITIRSYDVEGIKDPVITASANTGNEIYLYIYYIKDDSVKEIVAKDSKGIGSYYNVDTKKIDYYLITNQTDDKEHVVLLSDYILEKEEKSEFDRKIQDDEKLFTVVLESSSFYASEGVKDNLIKIIKNTKSTEKLKTEEVNNKINSYLEIINNKKSEEKKKVETITVGKYNLSLGTYKGKMKNSSGKMVDVTLVLNKKDLTIDGKKKTYKVSGKYLLVDDIKTFEVTGNNKVEYIVGDVSTLTYEG